MIRLAGITLLIIAALIVFNREKIENYKQRIIETINPAAKERRLLTELETNLDQLGSVLSAAQSDAFEKLSISDKQNLTKAAAQAKSALNELKETNQKTDLVSNLSNLIQKLVPFDSKPSPTWLPPGQECK